MAVARSVWILLLLAVAACGSSFFQQPEVRVREVRLAGLGLRGGTLMFDLEVANPNRFALSADRLDYELAISDPRASSDTTWLDLARGTHAERFSIGSGETEHVEVPVEFTYQGLSSAAASALRSGAFNYRASGTVDVRTPIGTYQIPFRRGGMVTLLGSR